MERPICYSQQQIRSFDFLSGMKDYLKGGSRFSQALLGVTDTMVSGLSAAAQPVPNLSFVVAAGQIYQWAPTDATPYGALDTDTEYIYQQGYTPEQTITISTAQLVAGQSQWVLVRARFTEVNSVRPGDPTGGVLPYYNSANPLIPLQGPNNNGGIQPTVRVGFCELSLTYGAPATTGSHVPPAAGSGYVGLYLINLSFGQTTIGNGQILKAGPGAYVGYTQAPFLGGLLNKHHTGTVGNAPKIDLTSEVQNVLPFPNLPVSNSSPPVVGGHVISPGVIPIASIIDVNPNGNLAGQLRDLVYNSTGNAFYMCTTAGNSSTAVWTSLTSTVNNPLKWTPSNKTSTFTVSDPSGYFYKCNFAAASAANLPSNPADGTTYAFALELGSKRLTITASGAELINYVGQSETTLVLYSGRSGVAILVALGGAWYVS